VDSFLSEGLLRSAVFFLVRLVEAAGAVVIFSGAVVGFARFVWAAVAQRRPQAFAALRLDLGRFLALGLEFQLASDLLRTAVSAELSGNRQARGGGGHPHGAQLLSRARDS
jgi:uncharacterized membrane protein